MILGTSHWMSEVTLRPRIRNPVVIAVAFWRIAFHNGVDRVLLAWIRACVRITKTGEKKRNKHSEEQEFVLHEY